MVLALPSFAQESHFDGQSWWNHIKVLADDKMEGRDTGSEGLRQAQAYVVEHLRQLGLQPAGSQGFYQPVKFVSRQIVEQQSHVTLLKNGVAEPLTLGDDTYFNTRVELSPKEVKAPLVFVGYGLKIPEKNYDDFAGLDLKGKVVVLITGSPADVPAALASHYQTTAERWKPLKAAGAVGIISIPNPAAMDVPWSRSAANRTHPSMTLAGAEFNESAGQKLALTFNPAKAERLFAGSSHSFEEIAGLAKDRKPLPHFTLALSIAAQAKVETKPVVSANLAAVLVGSDPVLKNEYVVVSAHLDHVGVGAPVNGDSIYNGAIDNASGSSLLLDLATSFRVSQDKLRRSVLFLWVTAEEKGLLGSRYFAAHPTVPPKAMVADVNTDMFLPLVPLKVLTVYGLAESDLGDRVQAVADKLGVKVQPDPEPLRNVFIRSDQYNFIRRGIPALAMKVGAVPGSPEQEVFKAWLTNRYHAPSDDLDQPVDLSAAAKFEEICRGLVVDVANTEQRPQWKPDSFFRRYAQ
jgi:Zn-dependent M28 family amino/carboxypeptidase